MSGNIMFGIVLTGLFLGVMNGVLIVLLDMLMMKGHIFDFIRERVARSYAKKSGMEGLFENLPEWSTWTERADIYDQAYWAIALENKRFTRWICPYCMSAYTFFFVAIAIIGYGSWGWHEVLLILMGGMITNYLTIKWIV